MQDLNNTKYTMHIFGLSTSNKNVLKDVSQVYFTNVKQNVHFKMEMYLIVQSRQGAKQLLRKGGATALQQMAQCNCLQVAADDGGLYDYKQVHFFVGTEPGVESARLELHSSNFDSNS